MGSLAGRGLDGEAVSIQVRGNVESGATGQEIAPAPARDHGDDAGTGRRCEAPCQLHKEVEQDRDEARAEAARLRAEVSDLVEQRDTLREVLDTCRAAFDSLMVKHLLRADQQELASLRIRTGRLQQLLAQARADALTAAEQAIGLFLEFRDQHGQDETTAVVLAAAQVRAGLGADRPACAVHA